MNYKPPYTITSTIVDLISRISFHIGKLEASNTSANLPMLRKVNQIKTITGTLQIEGSTLDEERITALLEGKRVLASVDELAEAKGAIALYKQLENLNYKDEKELLNSHRLLMRELLQKAGEYRTSDVGVGGREGVVHVAPPQSQVPKLMGDLFGWLAHTDEHPLIVSSVFHYEFEFIHPFVDGNGRMGRFWQSLILYRWQSCFGIIPIESIVRDRQQEYYQALETCGTQGESTVFVEFMLHAILEAIMDSVSENKKSDQKSRQKSDQKILKLIRQNNRITIKEMCRMLSMSESGVKKVLKKLKDEKRLLREGSLKAGHWIVPEDTNDTIVKMLKKGKK